MTTTIALGFVCALLCADFGGRVARSAPADATPAAVATKLAGLIAFAHEGDVWVMNADGTGRTRLTDHPAEDFDPSWSPDGSKIAFRSHRDGNVEVYVMDADGTDQTNLTRSPTSDYSPDWSPDGTRIAFASDRDGDPNEIYVMDADGSNQTRITRNPGIDEYPTWSPDGTRIAFSCTFGRVLPEGVGDFEICVVDADGTGLRQLTDAPGLSELPAWSPDGRTIAFQSDRDGWPSLPAYVPPAYEPGRHGEWEVYVMSADGSGQTNLTRNPREDDSFPAWSPDGRHLVFSRYGCLDVVEAGGAPVAHLSPDPCADGFPDWVAAPRREPEG
jgi:TolB protein